MSYTPISQILTLTPKTALAEVQGQVVDVRKQRTIPSGKLVQDLMLRDAAGAEIEVSVWEHEDLSFYKGKEVFINAGNKGKIEVLFDTYRQPNRNKLSVSKTCTFQLLQVHTAQTGQPAAAAPQASPQAQEPTRAAPVMANGAKVGMCVNNACLFLTRAGEPFDPVRVHQIASEILRISCRMEEGDLPALPVADEDVPY